MSCPEGRVESVVSGLSVPQAAGSVLRTLACGPRGSALCRAAELCACVIVCPVCVQRAVRQAALLMMVQSRQHR